MALELVLIFVGTKIITGVWATPDPWFSSLVAISLGTLLLEPWFPKPQDTLANSVIAVILYVVAKRQAAGPGWSVFASLAVAAFLLSTYALAAGARRSEGALVRSARIAKRLASVGTAVVIYTASFWLDLLDFSSPSTHRFWAIGSIWIAVLILSQFNWQVIWSSVTGGPLPCAVEGMIGPSRLTIAASDIPPPGTAIKVGDGTLESQAVILSRIRRPKDVWAQVHVASSEACEILSTRPALTLTPVREPTDVLLGVVEEHSTHETLAFSPTKDLEIGKVVAVDDRTKMVLYQISQASVESSNIKGGGQLLVRCRAGQIGHFQSADLRLVRHRWVPNPGSPVIIAPQAPLDLSPVADDWLKIGTVIGTEIPVFMDAAIMSEGHLAVLGMTKMGKTTFALRLARKLAETCSVTILDQSGEYVGRKGLPVLRGRRDDRVIGLRVFEPKPGEVAADRANEFLRYLVDLAVEEYRNNDLFSRVLIVDEAHQFIPEPAGLGFNAPGRDAAYSFGLLMMQVRKYGISIVLISQRTAVVAKSALSQCENIIAFKQVDQTGLDYLEAVIGSNARQVLTTLRQGEAIVFGPSFSADGAVAVKVTVD